MFSLRCYTSFLVSPLLALLVQSASGQARPTLNPRLMVQVEGLDRRPIAGVRLTVRGLADVSPPSTAAGRTQIPLGPATQPGTRVTLRLIQSPPGKDLAILSPWDEEVMLPPAGGATQNFVSVILVERRARHLLEDSTALAVMMRQVISNDQRSSLNSLPQGLNLADALARVAQKYGLSPDSVDAALRAWSARPHTGALERGLAALYAGHFSTADQCFMEADSTAAAQLVEVRWFRAKSLSAQGRYREAAAVLQTVLQMRPDNPRLLNTTGEYLVDAGDYATARPLIDRALAIRERVLGPEHPDVAQSLTSLAVLLAAVLPEDGSDTAHLELTLRRALNIEEKLPSPDSLDLATTLHNVGMVLAVKGDTTGAEPLLRRAHGILTRALGSDDPKLAWSLTGLAILAEAKHDSTEAERLFRQALAISEKAHGPEHPDVASAVTYIAGLLQAKRDYAAAEPLYRRALAIRERVLGDHPSTVESLVSLANILRKEGKPTDAEPLLRRGIEIRERRFGPDDLGLARPLESLAGVLEDMGDTTAAEPLYRRTLRIREKALGPDHRNVAASLYDLARVLILRGEVVEGEPLVRRAHAILEQRWGKDDPDTRTTSELLELLEQLPKCRTVQQKWCRPTR